MAELFKVNAPVRKPLFEGVQGENEARSIQFDITPWVEELGDGAVTATAKRSQDSQPYPVTVTKDGTTVTWKPTSTDTAFAGVGSFQLEYTVDDVLAKTCIWSTMVAPSLDPAGDPPDPYDNWLAEMREIAADAIQAAQDADESADDAQDSADAAAASASSIAGDHDELINIRVGADGTTYPSAGDAVRGQVSDLKSDLQDITEETTTEGYDTDDNLVDGLSLISGYIASNGALVSNANFSHLDIDVSGIEKIKVDGTHHIYTTSQFTVLGTFFDADDTVVGTIADLGGQIPSSFPYEANVPQTAVKLSLNTDYKASDYPSSLPNGLHVYPWGTISAVRVPFSAIEKEPAALQDISSGSKKIKIVAGVIRNSGDGWKYINDTGHEPLNLDTVSVDAYGRIVVGYTFTASKVLSLVVCPDDTFADTYTVGGSVGLSNTAINVYKTPVTYGGRVLLSNGSVNTTYGTFTSGTFNTTTGELKLFHPTVDGLLATQKFNISATPASVGVSIALGSQGNDYVSLYLVDSSGNIIKNITDNSYDIYVARNVNAARVDANDIVNAGGNFWIYGVMEI